MLLVDGQSGEEVQYSGVTHKFAVIRRLRVPFKAAKRRTSHLHNFELWRLTRLLHFSSTVDM